MNQREYKLLMQINWMVDLLGKSIYTYIEQVCWKEASEMELLDCPTKGTHLDLQLSMMIYEPMNGKPFGIWIFFWIDRAL